MMRSGVVEWAKASFVPLSSVQPGPPWDDIERLGEMIGDAPVVALSEGAHCAAEPLEFRNRLLQYLVEHKGFTAIAIESGIVEGRLVHDYVRGAAGDLEAVVARGISWSHGQLPQNRALVRWLRQHNADAGRRRSVNFYGFDMSGCPSSDRSYFGHHAALLEVLQFLARVDQMVATVFRARIDAFADNMRFHPRKPPDVASYGTLNQAERDALTATIADLVIWLERHEAKYIAASSAEEYSWACRAAIAARQMDYWLRQIPAGWKPSVANGALAEDLPAFFSVARDVRDRAQADNLDWIIGREGPEGKVLVFAARYHLSTSSLKVKWGSQQEESAQELAGTYLRRRLGGKLVTIGNLIGQGEVADGDRVRVLGRAPDHSLDGLAAEVGAPLFLLDLREAPADVVGWLNEERLLVTGSQTLRLPVGQAFDILFYVDTVTPARERALADDEVRS